MVVLRIKWDNTYFVRLCRLATCKSSTTPSALFVFPDYLEASKTSLHKTGTFFWKLSSKRSPAVETQCHPSSLHPPCGPLSTSASAIFFLSAEQFPHCFHIRKAPPGFIPTSHISQTGRCLEKKGPDLPALDQEPISRLISSDQESRAMLHKIAWSDQDKTVGVTNSKEGQQSTINMVPGWRRYLRSIRLSFSP